MCNKIASQPVHIKSHHNETKVYTLDEKYVNILKLPTDNTTGLLEPQKNNVFTVCIFLT